MSATARRSHSSGLQERRAALEAAVAAAIALLDDMDGEADLEAFPDDREPEDGGGVPNLTLHDQRRRGTYAGEPLTFMDLDEDPGQFVTRCEVGLS